MKSKKGKIITFHKVKEIFAFGTRGKAKDKKFTAKPDHNGKFVLNKKVSDPSGKNKTNMAKNKVYVDTLTDAANLLETDDYLINLICSSGSRALREYAKVTIIQ